MFKGYYSQVVSVGVCLAALEVCGMATVEDQLAVLRGEVERMSNELAEVKMHVQAAFHQQQLLRDRAEGLADMVVDLLSRLARAPDEDRQELAAIKAQAVAVTNETIAFLDQIKEVPGVIPGPIPPVV